MRAVPTMLGVLGILAAGCASSQGPQPHVSPTRTVTYCVDSGQPLPMDLYLPQRPSRGGAPVVLFVHGGAWVLGNLRSDPFLEALVPTLTARGIVVASIDYRLAPSSPFPAQMIDLSCAMRFLRATAPLAHLDPRHIAVVGSSAGGHLASLLALAPTKWTNAQWQSQSARPDAVVDLFGPTDLTTRGWSSLMTRAIAQTFGAAPPSRDERLVDASPVTYVAKGDPPFLIMQGTADTTVPPSQSQELATLLHRAGDAVTYVRVARGQHGLTTPGESPDESQLVQMISQFLDAQLHR